jgi:DNA processing protein
MHAERFAFELAQAGFTVVSGLAQGIDAAAHRGALKGRGRTLAVLGNGLPDVYPPEHRELAAQVAASGALISELPIGAPPAARNFPVRNRIIAALGLGLLVVEAARKSGALITARLANEMGKEVFAIPGDIGRPQTRGPHLLIRDGATLVESVQDILDQLGPATGGFRDDAAAEALPDPRALNLNPVERALYDRLDSVPKDIDTLTRETGLSPANAASTLLVLELRKLAVQMPGKRYVRPGTLQR